MSVKQHGVCRTQQTCVNRMTAVIVGYLALTVCLSVFVLLFLDARKKDAMRDAQLAAATDRQIAEQAIDESLNLGRAIINAEGIIIYWNDALAKWTDWPDAIGKPLVSIIPEHMRASHIAAFNAAIARVENGEKPKTLQVECVLPKKSDPTKVTHVTIVPSVVKPSIKGARPYVVALVFKTSQFQQVNVGSAKQ